MFVGVMRLGLMLPGARSLKDKRRVVLSFKERVQARMRVSIAEVGGLDHPRHATLGVAVVSNDAAVCDSVLADVAAMANNLPDAVLADRATEIVPFGEGGTGVRGGIEQLLGASGRASAPFAPNPEQMLDLGSPSGPGAHDDDDDDEEKEL